jgi:hypothetical protein
LEEKKKELNQLLEKEKEKENEFVEKSQSERYNNNLFKNSRYNHGYLNDSVEFGNDEEDEDDYAGSSKFYNVPFSSSDKLSSNYPLTIKTTSVSSNKADVLNPDLIKKIVNYSTDISRILKSLSTCYTEISLLKCYKDVFAEGLFLILYFLLFLF